MIRRTKKAIRITFIVMMRMIMRMKMSLRLMMTTRTRRMGIKKKT